MQVTACSMVFVTACHDFRLWGDTSKEWKSDCLGLTIQSVLDEKDRNTPLLWRGAR